MNSRERQNDVALEDELSIRRRPICYRGRAEGNYRSEKNEVAGPRRERHSFVDMFGCKSKFSRCKEQYCIGPWNTQSMNQGKSD